MNAGGARVGVLHPGAMGAAVGAQLVAEGVTTLWSRAGRGDASQRRAETAGLVPCSSMAELATCSVIISVCPPAAALDVAETVAATGFDGVYVEANAISPRRCLEIATLLGNQGVVVVDGGIVGPPPRETGTTRLYLSGHGTAVGQVHDLFAATALRPMVVEGPVGRASALKLAFATYNKLSYAVAAQAYALADSHGVRAELGELAGELLSHTPLGQPHGIVVAGQRAWRWEGEMGEIGSACADAAVPAGLLRAAQAVFERWSPYKDDDALTVEQLIAALHDER